MSDDIGTTIKTWRKRRGITQAALAGLAGVSQPYISQIEAGLQAVDKRSLLVAIAGALQVTVADLLGQPGDPTDPNKTLAAMSIPAIRVALAEVDAGCLPAERGSLSVLRNMLDLNDSYRARCDFASAAPMMPTMLTHAAAHGPALAAEAAHDVASLLRSLGYRDLGWRAADYALHQARITEDDKFIAACQFMRLMCMPPEAHVVISASALSTANELQGRRGPYALRGYGSMHLPAALAAAQAGRRDEVNEHLNEAWQVAQRIGEPDTPGGLSMSFGVTNVGLWKMASLLEEGEWRKVVEVADTIHPQLLPHSNRQSHYWLDRGRALSHIPGRDRDAVLAFAQAERVAPQYMRALPAARNAVHALIGRARQRSIAGDLRSLANRLGLTTV